MTLLKSAIMPIILGMLIGAVLIYEASSSCSYEQVC